MLNKGDQAPDFEFTDNEGQKRRLSELTNKRVILYFYPKDNTPGCTSEACSFRDHFTEMSEKDLYVIGVSADSEKSHSTFREKYQLPFPIVSDEKKELINAYGVWGQKKFMGKVYDGILRTTFIISKDRIIEQVITKVETKSSFEQVIKTIKI